MPHLILVLNKKKQKFFGASLFRYTTLLFYVFTFFGFATNYWCIFGISRPVPIQLIT